ncbi:MAG: TonB-dependent receptor [Acidobacteria bacterium]|nr:TonB-dependent receptor [Acidobacteriota bacterium]
MTNMKRIGLSLVVLLWIAAASSAGQGGTGTIDGTVSDESGAVLPGVTVSAAGDNGIRYGVSNTDGRYEISSLEPGRYEVEALLQGFLGTPASVSVTAGRTASANLSLAIAPMAETVTVTRTDQSLSVVPNSIAVVQRDQIEFAERRTSLDESLRGIPGLFVQNRRNYGLSGGIGISIRAPQPRFGLRGIAIIQDGIPITTADGTTEPGNVDLGSVGRIEVIRGPSSVLYGNSAGGVINLTTTFDRSRKLTIRPDVQFGSYGYNRQQIRADGGDAKTQFMFSASRFETDGFRANSAAEILQTNLLVRRELGPNTELRGVFNFNDTPYAESPSFLTEAEARREPLRDANDVCIAGACLARGVALARNWGESARQGQGGLTLEHRFSETDRLRVTGWGMWRDLDAVGAFRNVTLGRNGFGFRSEYLGGTQAGTVGLDWAAGFDLSSQNDDRMEFGQVAPAVSGGRATKGALDIDQTEDVLSAGPFAQIGISPNDRVRFSAGVRWDHYDFTAGDRRLEDGDQSGDRTMSQVSPSVGVTFAAANGVNLFGNVATAYETPTTVELSQSPTGGGGFNQELGPQDLTSVEFGARGLISPARLRYEATVFVSTVDNALVSFQNASEEVFFRNAGKSSRDGVELALDWVPTASFSTRVAYTYQDFVFEEFVVGGKDFAGNLEPGAPRHRMFFGANYTAPFGLRSGATVRWVDKFATNNANTVFNWSYTVVDLRFGYDGHWGGVDVRPFLGIDNLFDERYNSSIITNGLAGRFFEPSPDREFYVGLTIGTGLR